MLRICMRCNTSRKEMVDPQPGIEKGKRRGTGAAVKQAHACLSDKLQELSIIEKEVQRSRDRELCLVDMCIQQEILQHVLQMHQVWLMNPHQQPKIMPGNAHDAAAPAGADVAAGMRHSSSNDHLQVHSSSLQEPSERHSDNKNSLQEHSNNSSSGNCSNSSSTLQELVHLASPGNRAISTLLKTTPEQVRHIVRMTTAEFLECHTQLFTRLALLLELIRPDRYLPLSNEVAAPETETGGNTNSSDAGIADAAPLPSAGAPAATAAGASAVDPASGCDYEQYVRQLEDLVGEALLLGGLVLLHNPTILFETAQLNYSTMKPAVAPQGHFTRMALRLKLSSHQVQHMAIALEQYTRTIRAARAEGIDLLKMTSQTLAPTVGGKSGDATRAQQASGEMAAAEPAAESSEEAAAATAAAEKGKANETTASTSAAATAAATAGGSHAAPAGEAAAPAQSANEAVRSSCRSSARIRTRKQSKEAAPAAAAAAAAEAPLPPMAAAHQGASRLAAATDAAAAEVAAQGDKDDGLSVEDKLQLHLRSRVLHMQVIGMLVVNCLSPLQIAHTFVAAWPYYPAPPAIAEAAVQQCSFGHMLAAGSMPDPLLERDREQHWEQRMKTLQQQLRYWHGKLDKA